MKVEVGRAFDQDDGEWNTEGRLDNAVIWKKNEREIKAAMDWRWD